MRIIAGDAKGRQILFPKGSQARPTSDSIRENLFNILSSVQDKIFLDLYAGSGSIGMEALSRGAAFCFFIEKDAGLSAYIEKNLRRCGFIGRYAILKIDAHRIASLRFNKKIDIIFADPPYDEGLVGQTLNNVGKGILSSEDSILIIQHSVREKLPMDPEQPFVLRDQRKYGDTLLSFLNRRRK